MKHQYFGDVSDYRKYGLLRGIQRHTNLRLGVCWMLNLLVKLHPDVAMCVLEQERDLLRKLQKGATFSLELRKDPLLKPDELKLVVKCQGRDVIQQYALA